MLLFNGLFLFIMSQATLDLFSAFSILCKVAFDLASWIPYVIEPQIIYVDWNEQRPKDIMTDTKI